LGDVGVLVFIDQQVTESVLVGFEDVGMVLKQRQPMQQQVAEIGGVENLEPVLVFGIKRMRPAAGLGRRLGVGYLIRG